MRPMPRQMRSCETCWGVRDDAWTKGRFALHAFFFFAATERSATRAMTQLTAAVATDDVTQDKLTLASPYLAGGGIRSHVLVRSEC
jgi:hypothetical protein